MTGPVGDEEHLFRRVQSSVGDQLCYQVDGGRTVFLHAAFNDPQKRPSVDRAILKYRLDPNLSRRDAEDGIVSLQAAAIRRLGPIAKLNEKGKATEDKYVVDVAADPVLGNCAHATVAMSPSTVGVGTFKRLKEGLARLATEAGWTVEPNATLPNRYGHQVRDILICLQHRLRRRL
ncbi:MAG: hypothetical protein ACKVQA_20550 [Burkholderiales bacterium]